MLPGTRSDLIGSLFFGALLALSLYYLADFSLKQTAALVLLVGLFYFVVDDILRRVWDDKHPTRYWVSIRPKWREMLFDHGLVQDEQGWQQWLERIKTAPASEHSFLGDGFHFTVLQQDRDLRSQFVFRNDSNYFAKKLDMTQPIPGIKIERPGSPLGPALAWINLVWIPSFIVSNPTWGGYELSLTIPASVEEPKGLWLSSRFKLAFLTALEFTDHEIRPRGWIDSKAYQEQQQARRKSLEENGWTRAEKEYEYGKPSHIEHKYFTVTHESI
jgi:hypothetical protein